MVVPTDTVAAGTATITGTPVGKGKVRRKETVAGTLPGALSSLRSTGKTNPEHSGPVLRQ